MEERKNDYNGDGDGSPKVVKRTKPIPKTYIFRDEVDQGAGGVTKSRIWLQEPNEDSLKYMKSKLPLFKYLVV